MLVEFTIENYKSFRDRATFSMLASHLVSEDKSLDDDVIIEASGGVRLLTSSAVFGANASGKSNLVEGFRFMRRFVLDSVTGGQSPDEIPVEPFLLNTTTRDAQTLFEVVIMIGEHQYRYGFECTRRQILSEWLFVSLSSRETTLFTRELGTVHCGRGFREGKGLAGHTRPNSLFLSVVAQFNGSTASEIAGWFKSSLATSGLSDDQFRSFMLDSLKEEEARAAIERFVGALDLGIHQIGYLPGETKDYGFPASRPEPMPWLVRETKAAYGIEPRVRALHNVRDADGNIVEQVSFDVDRQESQGTRKLIALAAPLLMALDRGLFVFIDEFDARLHPILTRAIVAMFNDPAVNRKGAQLVFVTHDTNLLDRSIFRRDQIWFVEKGDRDESRLTSLAEFRVKNDAAYEKNYLQGRYSAIPYLGDLTALSKVMDAAA